MACSLSTYLRAEKGATRLPNGCVNEGNSHDGGRFPKTIRTRRLLVQQHPPENPPDTCSTRLIPSGGHCSRRRSAEPPSNPKAPDQGGAKKSEATKPKAWLEQTRASWAEQANRALDRAGCPEQIHAGSLAQQLTEAERR